MKETNDGGPAFPVSYQYTGHPGMSLRDWFAGMALQGMRSDKDNMVTYANLKTEKPIMVVLSELAYEQADAMLAERAKS